MVQHTADNVLLTTLRMLLLFHIIGQTLFSSLARNTMYPPVLLIGSARERNFERKIATTVHVRILLRRQEPKQQNKMHFNYL